MTATIVPRLPPLDERSMPAPRKVVAAHDRGDRIFKTGTLLTGLAVLALMVAVGMFLGSHALPALRVVGFRFLTTSDWQVDRGSFGIAAVLTGTVLIALVAVSVALPI